jgi:hypothetical protein
MLTSGSRRVKRSAARRVRVRWGMSEPTTVHAPADAGSAAPADLPTRWAAAPTFSESVAAAVANAELWRSAARLARVPDEVLVRAAALHGRWHLLVLSEDWCGDAVNTVPFVARLADLTPGLDLRVVGRDANPDLMDTHLTGVARSIPVIILYDEAFVERGWWGPRPAPLQEWVFGPEGQALDKTARYRHVRGWYARDRGRTTLDEILTLLERGSSR